MRQVLLALMFIGSSTATLAVDRTHTSKGEKLEYVNGQWVWVAPMITPATPYQSTNPYSGSAQYNVQTPERPSATAPAPTGYKYVTQYSADCRCYKTYLVSLVKK